MTFNEKDQPQYLGVSKKLSFNLIDIHMNYTVFGIKSGVPRIHKFVLTPGRYVGTPDEEDDGIPFKDKMKKSDRDT